MKESRSKQNRALPYSRPLYQNNNWFQCTLLDCAWCNQRFDSIEKLELHVTKYHPFNCNFCIKTIKTWSDFLQHSETCESSRRNLVLSVLTAEK